MTPAPPDLRARVQAVAELAATLEADHPLAIATAAVLAALDDHDEAYRREREAHGEGLEDQCAKGGI